MAKTAKQIFDDTVADAVSDFTANGYDNPQRLEYWLDRIRKAAEDSLVSPRELEAALQGSLRAIFRRLVDRGGLVKYAPGVARFTVERVKPQLRTELDKRILASANLIKLNRENAIAATLQRFSGWATSIPKGGSDAVNRTETKIDIRKAMQSLPFRERRVVIDQGHKFTASLADILAKDNNALAGRWRHHYVRYPRAEHVARDGKVYAVRGNWALEDGLMNKGAGYTDDMTAPGEEVLCRCTMTYLFSLRDLPPDMLTAKGRGELQRVRVVA